MLLSISVCNKSFPGKSLLNKSIKDVNFLWISYLRSDDQTMSTSFQYLSGLITAKFIWFIILPICFLSTIAVFVLYHQAAISAFTRGNVTFIISDSLRGFQKYINYVIHDAIHKVASYDIDFIYYSIAS